jgi:transcription factor SFP1
MDSPSLQPVTAGLNFNALVAAGPSTVLVSECDSLLDPQIDTMDEMELDVDIDDSQSSSGSGSHSGASTPSPPMTPVLPFDTTAIRRPSSTFASIPLISGGGSASTSPRYETAFNRYAEYTEFSAMLPGTITSSEHTVNPDRISLHSRQSSKSKACLPPALLSSSNTPQTSRAPSPSTPTSTAPSVGDGPSRQGSVSSVSSSGLSRPASSLLLAKPFRCPKPGCNKSYKQANGLKYHLQHGSCNFAPRDESIDCLSEKEAEARLKPYQCQVPPCTRRYKNMNGLRYHYQHSGAHGAIGLALLASGQHEHVHSSQPHNNDLSAHAQYQVKRSRPSSLAGSANSSARSSPAPSRTSTPLSTPTITQSQAHANGFSFFQQQPVQQFQQHPRPHQQQQTMMADVSMTN